MLAIFTVFVGGQFVGPALDAVCAVGMQKYI